MENRSRTALPLVPDRTRIDGDCSRNDLSAMIYQELRDLAARMMQGERPGHKVAPTAAMHEAVMRILREEIFGGVRVPEITSALDVSVAPVKRDCRVARAWRHGQIRDGRLK